MTIKIEKYLAYKDSGVEWLGEIPEDWKVIRFKFLTNIQKGKLPKKIVSSHDLNLPPYMSMEYLRGGDQNQWVLDTNPKIIDEHEILLLWDGSNAGEFIKSRKGVISSTVAQIVFTNINKDFAWYYCKFLEIELRSKTIGMGIPHVNGEILNALLTLVPSQKEQIAIIKFLDRKTVLIDQATIIKQKQIELLKERRQILIHNAVTRGLNPNVKMKDSGVEWIGKIPEHWEIVNNRILFNERNEPGNDSLPLLSVSIHTAVSSGELDDDENLRGKIKIENKENYKFVKIGDIVFNMMRAWQGAIGAVRTEGMVSPAYIVAKPSEKICSDFFEYQYRTQAFIQQMDRFSKGITDFRKRLYWNEFKNLKVVLPSSKEQKLIVEYISNISNKIKTAMSLKEKEIDKLKEYKATLINGAVTGKIKIG